MPVVVGEAAPPFSLTDAAGHEVALHDFLGKNVILYFYPRDNTPGCTREAQGFRDLWPEIERQQAVVLGVSPDGADAHAAFCREHALPFTLLSDPERTTMERYGAYGKRMLYGKLASGVIRSTVWIGPDGKVRKHWARVRDAARHPAEVLAALAGR